MLKIHTEFFLLKIKNVNLIKKSQKIIKIYAKLLKTF